MLQIVASLMIAIVLQYRPQNAVLQTWIFCGEVETINNVMNQAGMGEIEIPNC